jgi:hypothetical protein
MTDVSVRRAQNNIPEHSLFRAATVRPSKLGRPSGSVSVSIATHPVHYILHNRLLPRIVAYIPTR